MSSTSPTLSEVLSQIGRSKLGPTPAEIMGEIGRIKLGPTPAEIMGEIGRIKPGPTLADVMGQIDRIKPGPTIGEVLSQISRLKPGPTLADVMGQIDRISTVGQIPPILESMKSLPSISDSIVRNLDRLSAIITTASVDDSEGDADADEGESQLLQDAAELVKRDTLEERVAFLEEATKQNRLSGRNLILLILWEILWPIFLNICSNRLDDHLFQKKGSDVVREVRKEVSEHGLTNDSVRCIRVVMTNGAKVKVRPSRRAETVRELGVGDLVFVVAKVKEWCQVAIDEEKIGWVKSKHLKSVAKGRP